MDALHVIAGVLLQLVGVLLFRRGLADWRPWVLVASLEILNEIADLLVEQWPSIAMQAGEGAKDLLLTLFLPTILLTLSRWKTTWLTPAAR